MNENNNKHIKTDDYGIKVIEVKSEKELWQHIMEEQKRSVYS